MSSSAIALNRFGLGARPNDRAPADPRDWLLASLDDWKPEAPAKTGAAAPAIEGLARLAAARRRSATGAADVETARMEIRPMIRDGYVAAAAARLDSAIASPAPFAERLVHFWSNHLAISADRIQTLGLAGAYEAEAIRPHILGSYADLLLAATRHPGMLLYLDQAQSIGPQSALGSRAARFARRPVGLNENLAREILELHTLGVDGGYTQADVGELARALTGWSVGGFVRRPIGIGAPAGSFVFQPGWHQPGARTLLGKRYPEAGEAQAVAMLRDLATHPATARHLATKLARHFAADVAPPTLVARLERAWRRSGGDLPTVYRALVEAPEPWAEPTSKVKSPWEWLVSALRATGATRGPGFPAIQALAELGQPVWRPGSPAGFPDVAAHWAAPDALLRRVEAADRIARASPTVDARALAPAILPAVLTDRSAEAIARADSGPQAFALLLASPEFLRR
jgi:uncharacterized protein (DUF1800 family)